ncbi:hypothetical protein KFE94_11015 [bacterium SCSIO 12643]|nr:hypothetical protein KFE94_11015 [bacterium SCSIO 12643]
MLEKDKIWVGLVIGTLLPLAIYTIFILGMDMADRYVSSEISEKFQLVLIAVNAIVMRQFMIKRNQDNIGKGILIVTFLGVMLHMLYYYTDMFKYL